MPGLLKSSRSSSTSDEGPNVCTRESILPKFEHSREPADEVLESIAVVGMGCRLPGDVRSATDFWDMMMDKRTGNTPRVPSSRFNIDAHYHKNNDRPGSFGVMGGYFLTEDLTDFDPGLFGITPVEAMWMDPQQRKLLEVVYEALESGGIPMEAISGTRTAVFAASFTADWQQMAFKEPSFRHNLAATGVDPGIISNRISHVFNLKGPSILCNTACSSSIYALHNACNALRNNEADGAIVGGVNLIITVDQHMNTAKLGVLSPTSICHTFDESADGYGRADAVGAVYLKRLSDAIRDGDPIRGVIRSSATNSNGKVPAAGITHPNLDGQVNVVSQAYERGNLDPQLTGYFECHGTGTAVGDPLEVHALSLAMNKERRPEDGALYIGAVKPNIGHSEAASGLSALIKAVLIVERGIIPPTRGLVNLNPHIEWDNWQVKVSTEPLRFPSSLPIRRVSVNSFGYGGTNAHVIIDGLAASSSLRQTYKYIEHTGTDSTRKHVKLRRASHRKRPFLLLLSAHDSPTLKKNIAAHGRIADKYDLLDLSFTLASRRSVLQSKAFAVVSQNTLEETFTENATSSFTYLEKRREAPVIGFVFTGQGAQWPRMGAELIEYSSHFLTCIRALDRTLGDLVDGPEWTIEDVLLEHAKTSPVSEAEFSQPLCTAIQIGLVQLLAHWGIRPVATVGHSSGEMAAAYTAGLISAEGAIVAAYYRGKVSSRVQTDGVMLAVGLGADAAQQYLDGAEGQVVVACHNSPSAVTLSGDRHAIETIKSKLDVDGIFARVVKTTGKAYHSHHMARAGDEYEAYMRGAKLPFKDSQSGISAEPISMVSSVTNTVLDPNQKLDGKYWSRNLRNPVLFNDALQTILKSDDLNVNLLIEIGPHSAMAGPIKQIRGELKAEKLEYLPTLLRDTDSAAQLLRLAGELFLRNYPMDMRAVTGCYCDTTSKRRQGRVIVDLPPYQWNYTRPFWAENRASQEHRQPQYPRHDVLGQLVIGSSMAEPTWRNVLRVRDLPWLQHHTLGGETVFPAAGYFAMAIEAATQMHEAIEKPEPVSNYVLRDISIEKPLVVPSTDDGIETIFSFHSSQKGDRWWDFSISSVDVEKVHKDHMVGSISINTSSADRSETPQKIPIFPQRASGKAWNQALREVGFDYGATFQDMDDIRFDGKTYAASSSTNIKQHVDDSLGESRYVLHPASVDSILQLSIAAIYAGRTQAMKYGVVPVQIDEVAIWPPSEAQLTTSKAKAYAWVPRRGTRSFEGSAQMTAHDGKMVLDIVNVRTISYEAAVPQKTETEFKNSSGAYGDMVWAQDLDSLGEATGTDDLTSSDLVGLAMFKFPDWEILEVGASFTSDILQRHPLVSYTAALTSADEDVDRVKALTASHPRANVVELDSFKTLASGKLKSNSYDVLVLSARTVSTLPGKSLRELRNLLKTDGYIIGPGIMSTNWQVDSLPGVKWILQKSGGVSLGRATKMSSKSSKDTSFSGREAQLVYRAHQNEVVAKVRTSLEAQGWNITVSCLDSFAAPLDHVDGIISVKHIIMLADFEGPLLYTVTEREFSAIQIITNSASALLWVTVGGLLQGKDPTYALTRGFARTLASEQASLDFRTLDIDLDNSTPSQAAKWIVHIATLQARKGARLSNAAQEREFSTANNKLYISRLIRNLALNNLFSESQDPKPMAFTPKSRIRGRILQGKVVFKQEPEISKADDTLSSDLAEVQIQAAGLIKESVLAITGSDYSTHLSHEIGGVVTRVGPDVTAFKQGDMVVGLHFDKFSSYQSVPSSMLYKLDDATNLNTIVGSLIAYANAMYGLETLARVTEHDIVLILNNTGASGAAAVKVAQKNGAVPYVEARTASEVAFLKDQLGLDEKQIILTSCTDTSLRIEEITQGRGADIVFSVNGSVERNSARESWRHIGHFGRFVEAGRRHLLGQGALDTIPLARGALYLPFDIVDLYEARPQYLASLLPAIVKMIQEGSFTAPASIESVHVADIHNALSTFSESFGATKPVIQYVESKGSLITVLPTRRARPQFDPSHSYLLVGCLGGIGRSLTAWMMENGARRFIFLSRSGAASRSAAQLVQELETRAAVQVVSGDATSRADVVRAVKAAPAQHPIRGVVHAAMVLRDGLFHSMSFDDWKAVIAPKVTGATNLHSVLSGTPLDFFIMTSSVSGTLGTPGQSNYAAANSYLDALARHRLTAGEVATSIILPMILGVGIVAENLAIEESLQRKGIYGIDEEQLLESFEAAIVAHKILEQAPDHIASGLDPKLLHKAVREVSKSDVFWLEDTRLSHVAHAISAADNRADTTVGGDQGVLTTIRGAACTDDAVEIITKHFISKLAHMLMMQEESFEPHTSSIASYGIDSMIGAELRNWIFKEYKIDIPFQQLLAPSLTIQKFALQVCASASLDNDKKTD